MIPITINDQQFEISPDLSVLEAAREHGIHIPTLCYHEALESVGACRLFIGKKKNACKVCSIGSMINLNTD
ncbi:MAG: 2Fe-2S iron-sulfur cluster-binding protein [candidate division KSB1 bacterium]|nr:2Fe-2S iron-sulfur cluster-binding protein [candidate division KSB1 bacterium]